jgi:hypothetical protein
MKYRFELLRLNDCMLSGEIEFSATTPNELKTLPWDMKEDNLDIDWKSLDIEYFDNEENQYNENIAPIAASGAILGFGVDNFRELMRIKIIEYCDKKHLWT